MEETIMKVIPSEGFTMESFGRGVLGMVVILLIAFLFSSNRRAINWRTVGIGLSIQLLLAIGILKVGFIQKAFDFAGSVFVLILDFTKAGSQFLLGNLLDRIPSTTYYYLLFSAHLSLVLLRSYSNSSTRNGVGTL